eukprot:5916884-Alexandrium_andersonii.AAC.1
MRKTGCDSVLVGLWKGTLGHQLIKQYLEHFARHVAVVQVLAGLVPPVGDHEKGGRLGRSVNDVAQDLPSGVCARVLRNNTSNAAHTRGSMC